MERKPRGSCRSMIQGYPPRRSVATSKEAGPCPLQATLQPARTRKGCLAENATVSSIYARKLTQRLTNNGRNALFRRPLHLVAGGQRHAASRRAQGCIHASSRMRNMRRSGSAAPHVIASRLGRGKPLPTRPTPVLNLRSNSAASMLPHISPTSSAQPKNRTRVECVDCREFHDAWLATPAGAEFLTPAARAQSRRRFSPDNER